MIKAIITAALGLLVLNIIAACKAAGDADREWEENSEKDKSDHQTPG